MKIAFRGVHIFTATSALCGSMALAWLAFAESESPPLKHRARAASIAIPKIPTRQLAADFEAIVRRPLFSPTRKPSPLPEAAPQPIPARQEPPPTPLVATLIGIVISPDVRSAVLRMSDGKNITIAEGESVDGWKLSEVMPDAARFKHVAATVELSFPVSQPHVNPTRSSALSAAPVRRRW